MSVDSPNRRSAPGATVVVIGGSIPPALIISSGNFGRQLEQVLLHV
jgi:hypothetical protein